MESASQPETQGFPIPRATTAACDVIPPCAVRTAPRLDDAVDVVRRRLGADEDDRLARPPLFLRPVGVEDDLPGRSARRSVEPLGGYLVVGSRIDHRVEELVELRRVDPRDRLLPA